MVLTIVSLVVGYLTLSLGSALLYATWLSDAGNELLAFASVCSLGFATLSGWLTALIAQRASMTHAIALALILTLTLAIAGGLYAPTGELEEGRSLLLYWAIAMTGIITGGWLRLQQMKRCDRASR